MQARPHLKDRKKFPGIVDPLLQSQYPMRGLYRALSVVAMCVQEQAALRPLIGDVVTALTYLTSQRYDPNAPASLSRGGTPRLRDTSRRISDADSLGDSGRGGQKGSPSAHNNSRDSDSKRESLDRERAVAAAKAWGESGREKKRTSDDTGNDKCE